MYGGGGNLDISTLSHRVINTIQQRHRTTKDTEQTLHVWVKDKHIRDN
jgi:hypothetical protein